MFPPLPLLAQAVRGVVVAPGGVPVPGVVIQLVDSTSGIAARALTGERGEFRLIARHAGTYRITTLRIGYRPVTTQTFVLRSGQELARRLELESVPFALGSVRVDGRSFCRISRDTAAAAFAVWEQARAALTATELTASAQAFSARMVSRRRVLDARSSKVLRDTAFITTELVSQPWRSLPVDSLRLLGYVSGVDQDSTTYYAPGLDMLVSDAFVEDHCFRLTPGTDPALLGLAFEPASSRWPTPEIRGTLWVDRTTSALRRLEFQYANIPMDYARNAGGELEFVQMRGGGWAIARWGVRAPVFELRPARQALGRTERAWEASLAATNVAAGELVLALRSDGETDTLWATPPLALQGSVSDSVSGAALQQARVALAGTPLAAVSDAAGRFAIAGVLPGEYVLEVHTPSPDSARPVHRVPVLFVDSGVALRIRLPDARGERHTIATRTTGRTTAEQAGVLRGRVRNDADGRPIAGAEVVLPGITRTATTDSAGSFRMLDVPAGFQDAQVRSVGFVPLVTRIQFVPRDSTVYEFRLAKLAQTLPEVEVRTDTAPWWRYAEFEERRKAGFGHFITAADLVKDEGRRLSEVMARVPGSRILRGSTNAAWIVGSRGSGVLMGGTFAPTQLDARKGAVAACYAAVILDGAFVFQGLPGEQLFDLNSLQLVSIVGIEYYAGTASAPVKYRAAGRTCGLVVIWTR